MSFANVSFSKIPFDSETILVTGGCGFIGSHTSKELLSRGHRVIVVDELNDYYDVRIKHRNLRELRAQAESLDDKFAFHKGDIGDQAFVQRVFETERPTYVCHLAARAGVRASLEDPRIYAHSNVLGTTNILEMARIIGCRSVAMASSSSVYGDRKDGDCDALGEDGEPLHAFRETDPVVHPASPYAATKASCELLAYTFSTLYQLPVACLRFFTVYGPGGRPDMAPLKFVNLISRGMQIDRYGDGSAVRDFTYVSDIVDGTIRAMLQPQGFQIYNLGGGHPVTLGYFIKLVEDGLGTKAKIRELPAQPGDVGRTHASTRKARDQLGFEAKVRIEDGVLRTIQWFRDFQAEIQSNQPLEVETETKQLEDNSSMDLDYEGSIPHPMYPAKMLICTRMHSQDKMNERQRQQLTHLIEVALQLDYARVAIAVEWTPKRLTLFEDVRALIASKFASARHRIQAIPIANWGITSALNACLFEAARMDLAYICYQSLELAAETAAIEFLKSQVDDDTLVAGAALPGHRFVDGEHVLEGTNCPWNTFAVWAVNKLALTGFVAIGSGSVKGTQAGMEEASTITVIQQLRASSDSDDAQAKLLRVPGIEWETKWTDEERQIQHERKMVTKQERAAEHLRLLQLKAAIVSHSSSPCPSPTHAGGVPNAGWVPISSLETAQ